MIDIISIAGCPAIASGANAVLSYVQPWLTRAGLQHATIHLRHLPADELFLGRTQHSAIQRSRHLIQQASGLLITTSVQKFGYPGALTAFLDLLPPEALAGKQILLLATAASPAQFLSCETSLRTLLAGMGTGTQLDTVYLPNHLVRLHDRQLWLEGELQPRVALAVERWATRLLGSPAPVASLMNFTPHYSFSTLQSCS